MQLKLLRTDNNIVVIYYNKTPLLLGIYIYTLERAYSKDFKMHP